MTKTVTEEAILACTTSYLTHEQGRKIKIVLVEIKEHKMGYNLIYRTLKYDMIPRIPDYLKIRSAKFIQHAVKVTLSQDSYLRLPPSHSAVLCPPNSYYVIQSHYECVQTLVLGQGYGIYIMVTHLRT